MKNPSGLLAAALLAGVSLPALAQETAPTEIIVTAQKRAQRIIDVPMSISAFGAKELEQRSIQSINDLSFAVPGMVLREDGPGTQQIWMRGIGNLSGGESLVSVYLDETTVTLDQARQLDLRTMDLERIEVLKGPQGTLYGQGAVAGTVRFVTKQPKLDKFEGSVEGEIASVKSGDLRQKLGGVINVPVVKDIFAIRIAATAERGGGWIDQPEAKIKDGNNQDLTNVRLKALFRPNDKLDITGTVIVHRNESELGLTYEQPDRTVDIAVDRARRLIPRNNNYELYNLTGKYDLGFASLVSSTSLIHLRHSYPASYIAGPQTTYGVQLEGTDERYDNSRQFTQEVRLASSGSGPLKWTAGGFYRNAKLDFLALYDTLYAGSYSVNPPYTSNTKSRSTSFFADASYNLTPEFEVGVGIRQFRDKAQAFDGFSLQKNTFKSTDPRVFAKYSFTKDWNVYANVAKGFRSGGFNRITLPPYGPEKLMNYEIGTKALLPGGVDISLAAYRSDYTNMLRRGLVFVGTAFQDLTSNIGETRVKGLEGAINWRAAPGLTLNATGSYIDSEVRKVNVASAANMPGDPVDYVPKYAFTAGAMYEFAWAPNVDGFVRGDLSYRDKVHYTDRFVYLPQYAVQSSDAVTTVDVRAGAKWNAVNVEVFATNLFNTNKYVDPFVQFSQANRTRPRVIGLKAGYEF